MAQNLVLLFLLLLSACVPVAVSPAAEALPAVTVTPSVTVVRPPSVTPSAVFPSPTASIEGCDPFSADFCITDGHFIFQIPIHPPGNTFVDISYRYGSTQDGVREPHHGVEFLNKFGTPVHAAGDGVVQFAGPDKEAQYSPWRNFYGNMVVIRHAEGLFTLYAHLSSIAVRVGDAVKAGDVIGEVGQSGVATGSHLHFEIRKGGDGTDYFSTQNPELWLRPNKDESGRWLGAISLAIVNEKFDLVSAVFTIDYHRERNAPKVKTYYAATYEKGMMLGDENAALGGLPPGFYRIALKYNGHFFERWIEVQSGRLTQVVLVVK